MTPQENQLLQDFLAQLTRAQVATKDPDAQALIARALAQQPRRRLPSRPADSAARASAEAGPSRYRAAAGAGLELHRRRPYVESVADAGSRRRASVRLHAVSPGLTPSRRVRQRMGLISRQRGGDGRRCGRRGFSVSRPGEPVRPWRERWQRIPGGKRAHWTSRGLRDRRRHDEPERARHRPQRD